MGEKFDLKAWLEAVRQSVIGQRCRSVSWIAFENIEAGDLVQLGPDGKAHLVKNPSGRA